MKMSQALVVDGNLLVKRNKVNPLYRRSFDKNIIVPLFSSQAINVDLNSQDEFPKERGSPLFQKVVEAKKNKDNKKISIPSSKPCEAGLVCECAVYYINVRHLWKEKKYIQRSIFSVFAIKDFFAKVPLLVMSECSIYIYFLLYIKQSSNV